MKRTALLLTLLFALALAGCAPKGESPSVVEPPVEEPVAEPSAAALVVDTQYYDVLGNIFEFAHLEGTDSAAARAINDEIEALRAEYRAWVETPYQHVDDMRVAYPVTSGRYLNLVLHDHEGYGSDGRVNTWTYDSAEERRVDASEALARAGLTRDALEPIAIAAIEDGREVDGVALDGFYLREDGSAVLFLAVHVTEQLCDDYSLDEWDRLYAYDSRMDLTLRCDGYTTDPITGYARRVPLIEPLEVDETDAPLWCRWVAMDPQEPQGGFLVPARKPIRLPEFTRTGVSVPLADILPDVEPLAVVPLDELEPFDPANPLYDALRVDELRPVDLDGDGVCELVSADWQNYHLFLERGGAIYAASLSEIVARACPQFDAYWDLGEIGAHSLHINAYSSEGDWGAGEFVSCERELFYDGEALLIYRLPEPETVDHVWAGVDAPREVVDHALSIYRETAEFHEAHGGLDVDDYVLTECTLVGCYTLGGRTFAVYQTDGRFHAKRPGEVMLAGGMYVTESGWVGGLEIAPYAVFLLDDGRSVPLEGSIDWDCGPDSYIFRAQLTAIAMKNGAVRPSELTPFELAKCFKLCWNFWEIVAEADEAERESVYRALVQAERDEETAGDIAEALEAMTMRLQSDALVPPQREAYEAYQRARNGLT